MSTLWAFQSRWHLVGGVQGLSRCGSLLNKPSRVRNSTPGSDLPICKLCAGKASAKVDGVWHACSANPDAYVCGQPVRLPELRHKETLLRDKHCPGCYTLRMPKERELSKSQSKEVQKLIKRGYSRKAAIAMALDQASRRSSKEWSPDIPQPVGRGKRQR